MNKETKEIAPIILASQSRFRAQLLRNAGISFTAIVPTIEERLVEQGLAGSDITPADLAEILAIAKAENVSQQKSGTLVIGCDQTLSMGNEVFHKPKNMEEARRRLLHLSGKTHHLNSAICLVQNGQTLWSQVEICSITFRKLSPQFIGNYLAEAGDSILSSVGAYQIEGLGIQLFGSLEGDYFSIMGLPLLSLLAKLRELGAINQ